MGATVERHLMADPSATMPSALYDFKAVIQTLQELSTAIYGELAATIHSRNPKDVSRIPPPASTAPTDVYKILVHTCLVRYKSL